MYDCLHKSKARFFYNRKEGIMGVKATRQYGPQLPLGYLEGETITRKMFNNKEKKLSKKIMEFLQFCEALNRGQIT